MIFLFHFKIFENFENLEIGFSINLNKCFRAVVNIFEVTLRFQNISTQYKAGSNCVLAVALDQTYCWTSHIA